MSKKNKNSNSVALDIRVLFAHLWEVTNTLGSLVSALDFKTYIFLLLFFKKIFGADDEEYDTALEEPDGNVDFSRLPGSPHFQAPGLPLDKCPSQDHYYLPYIPENLTRSDSR